MNDVPVLWDAGQCAEYLRVARPYFLRAVACKAGFPARVPGSVGMRVGLWRAVEVLQWVNGDEKRGFKAVSKKG